MTTLPDPRLDSAQRQLRGRQTEIRDFDSISGSLPLPDSAEIAEAAERAFEGEVHPRQRHPVNLAEQEAPRGDGDQVRAEWRESGRDEICIDEVNHAGVFGKERPRERRLSRPIRPGDDDAARSMHG